MFKKLKDKIAEEVKQSPLKSVQQLAQAVVSPSSSSVFEPSSSNDKFCIEEGDIEEDEKQEQVKPGGFTSVALTGQTTSPVRDHKLGFRSTSGEDNLFPVFESQPTNFHVQSDWESASEVEDRYSQLEHINKESLYEAYRKVYNRYNRIKNKYHELVTHYRQLEREKEKAKTVLSDTQDKALLRISELKEQCLLEQQAKAHLEEALRNELEERDHIINTLKTKVQYLKGVNDSTVTGRLDVTNLSKEETENLIDFTENTSVSKVPLPSAASSSQESIEWFEEKIKKCNNLLVEETAKIESLKKKLVDMKKLTCDMERTSADTTVNDEISTSEQKIEEELNRSLLNLINDLSEEVNSLKKNTVGYSRLKSVTSNANLQSDETSGYSEKSLLKDRTNESCERSQTSVFLSAQGDGLSAHKTIDFCDGENDELKRQHSAIKELELQNQILSQRLLEEGVTVKAVKDEINSLKNIIYLVKTQLKTTNEDFESGNISSISFDTNNLGLVENDLIKELNLCLENMCKTRSELEKLENLNVLLETELSHIKDQMDNRSNNQSQAIQTEDENVTNKIKAANSKLKEELQSLKSENIVKVAQLESLTTEINNLKITNDELKSTVKKLKDSLSNSEKECSNIQQSLHRANLNFNKEKSEIQNKVFRLEKDLEDTKSDCLLLLKEKDKLSEELSSLKKESINVDLEKHSLMSKISDLECNLEQRREEYKEILEAKEKLDDELLAVNKENNDLITEKHLYQAKISHIEKDLDENNLNYLSILEEKDKLSEELACMKKEYDVLLCEKNDIQTQLDNLQNDCKSAQEEAYRTSVEISNKLSEELLSVRKVNEDLARESNSLKTTIENLRKDYENIKTQYLLEVEIKNKLVEELELAKKHRDDLAEERSKMKSEISKLEEDLKTTKNEMSSSTETKQSFAEELEFLKMEHLELNREKSSLQNLIKKLEEDMSHRKTDLNSANEANQRISEELRSLKQEQYDLSIQNSDLKNTIEKLEEEIKSSKDELFSLTEVKNKLSHETTNLRKEYDIKSGEIYALQGEFDNAETELKKSKKAFVSVEIEKNKLSDQLNLFRKKHDDAVEDLTNTKRQLIIQQQEFQDLNDQLCTLTESLRSKSEDVEEKYQENLHLKTELDNLLCKVDQTNCLVENLNKEKHSLTRKLLSSVTVVKNIKQLQQNLCDLVLRYKSEVIKDLNEINVRIEDELLHKLKSATEFENSNKQVFDIESKNKKYIDSYNSKIKNLHTEIQNTEEFSKSHVSVQENSHELQDKSHKNVSFTFQGHLSGEEMKYDCETSEPNNNVLHYYNRCKDLEINLKQAVFLIKSFIRSLKCNEEVSEYVLNDMFHPLNSDKYIELNQNENKPFQKHITALESFITDYETKCNSADVTRKLYSQTPESNKLDMNGADSVETQLIQELKLKDDIIKKLQFVVEEYEQRDHKTSIENHDIKNTEGLKEPGSTTRTMSTSNSSSMEEDNSESHQKIIFLEQENEALLQKLQKIQETHELNVKNLISDYEKKLEEVEEERSLYDFQKLETGKKFIVNEMKEQIENLQEDLDERGDAFEKLYVEHQQNVKQSREEEIQQLRNNYEKEMREQDKKWRCCLDRRLAEEETRHQEELASLTREWSVERKELETARRLAVTAVESGSSSSDLLRRQVQALTLQMTELQNSRCETCDQKSGGRERRRSRSRSIQDCTEMEYLRNILYEYMMGKEPLVLAKVLCALMKFDENQTQDIVLKEEQKITLFGQLGIL